MGAQASETQKVWKDHKKQLDSVLHVRPQRHKKSTFPVSLRDPHKAVCLAWLCVGFQGGGVARHVWEPGRLLWNTSESRGVQYQGSSSNARSL